MLFFNVFLIARGLFGSRILLLKPSVPSTAVEAYAVMQAAYNRYVTNPSAEHAGWQARDGNPADVLALAFSTPGAVFPDYLHDAAKVVDYTMAMSFVESAHSNKYAPKEEGDKDRQMTNYRVTCKMKDRKPKAEVTLTLTTTDSRSSSQLTTGCTFKLIMIAGKAKGGDGNERRRRRRQHFRLKLCVRLRWRYHYAVWRGV